MLYQLSRSVFRQPLKLSVLIGLGAAVILTSLFYFVYSKSNVPVNLTPTNLHDNFDNQTYDLLPSETSPNGKWYGMWNGNGQLSASSDLTSDTNVFVLSPQSADSKNVTHSALVVSTLEFQNFTLSADVRTDQQLREHNPPNSWESGWIMWHWIDPTHLYYIAMKTNGPEVGKYDGGTNPSSQIILKTKSSPQAKVGEWNHIDLKVVGNHIVLLVDKIKVFDFYDNSSFSSGKIGLYCEDSRVSFDNIRVDPL